MSMSSGIGSIEIAEGCDAAPERLAERPGLLLYLMGSAWCGIVSGLLEVGTTVLRKQVWDINQFYWTSRHFVCMVPAIDLAIFLLIGLCLWALARLAPHRGPWLAARLLAALTLLPTIWAAFPHVFGPAGFLLALGGSSRMVPVLERRAAAVRRGLRLSFPIVVGMIPFLAATIWVPDRIRAAREAGRPLPAAESPNVLLIVMDTVGADHLSLYGYGRPTSPTLDELAARAIRFEGAQAPSSWTLLSHASLFTGRWPHELSAGWFTPLDGTFPTLAESLSARGYATAGFVANYWYCATDSGLARGFTTYRDYWFPRLSALKMAKLVDRPLEGLGAVDRFLQDALDCNLLKGPADGLAWSIKTNRKGAEEVNREFLDWLSRVRDPHRPFFAFLNYYDVHYPYELPDTGLHRFGAKPRDRHESTTMRDWVALIQQGPSAEQVDLARAAYDDGIAELDEQLGCLMDRLDRRGILDRTWVIITGDHGESFGEHPGEFWHGTSLYDAQVHVPLLIVPPASAPAPARRSVIEPVSLRDLPATILDLLGPGPGAPFPGRSMARLWDGSSPGGAADHGPALVEVVPLGEFDPDPARWLAKPRWPAAALVDDGWKYIRQEAPAREELFRVQGDAQEQRNFAGDPDAQPTLARMRALLDRLTAGPLAPRRFNP